MHLEQASLCPHGPYAVNCIGSAQTTQYSSIYTDCQHKAATSTGSNAMLCAGAHTSMHTPIRLLLRGLSTAFAQAGPAHHSMAAFSGNIALSHCCTCNRALQPERPFRQTRTHFLCRARLETPHEQASEESAQHTPVSRRQAVLAAAAAVVLPSLSLPVAAETFGPAPPGACEVVRGQVVNIDAVSAE